MSNLIRDFSSVLSKESGKDQEILEFGLEVLITNVLDVIFILLIGFIFGVFNESLMALLVAGIFRAFSGGAHATSAMRCGVIGIFIFVGLGLIAKYTIFLYSYYEYLLIFTSMYSVFIAYRYVPSDTPSKPITSKVQKRNLRIVTFTLLIVVCFLLFYVSFFTTNLIVSKNITIPVILGMLWQFFSLTPLGYKIVYYIDKKLNLLSNLIKS